MSALPSCRCRRQGLARTYEPWMLRRSGMQLMKERERSKLMRTLHAVYHNSLGLSLMQYQSIKTLSLIIQYQDPHCPSQGSSSGITVPVYLRLYSVYRHTHPSVHYCGQTTPLSPRRMSLTILVTDLFAAGCCITGTAGTTAWGTWARLKTSPAWHNFVSQSFKLRHSTAKR